MMLRSLCRLPRLSTSLLLLGIWTTACSAGSTGPDPRLLSEPIVVDESLSPTQQLQTLRAVALWSEASGYAFEPTVTVGPVECGQPYAIKAVATEGCGVGQALDDDDQLRVLGVTDTQARSITVVAWLEGERFHNNVAHELGHYLHVGHGTGLMAQERWGQAPVLTDDTVHELCTIWDCAREPEATLSPTPRYSRGE